MHLNYRSFENNFHVCSLVKLHVMCLPITHQYHLTFSRTWQYTLSRLLYLYTVDISATLFLLCSFSPERSNIEHRETNQEKEGE